MTPIEVAICWWWVYLSFKMPLKGLFGTIINAITFTVGATLLTVYLGAGQ